ncbi:PQQ-binding-like beta-propeller repeat protein [Natrinema sp. SYSU A 869]|uniref:PQQ-binding-like beta-propeller repeat protein n=1 Tax=Natrinema sp. SYSU A 869 TaxID=2871694 RepID=UPI0021067D88|nr:PQQ-binding-like beta-propeller repeat protein [Natrinema sp. SYSU A 869]
MSQYDPAGTGHNPNVTGPTSDVEPAWVYNAPSWFHGASAPIRIGGTLYAVGTGVAAVNVEDGSERFVRRGPYTSSFAVADAEPYRTPTLAVTSTGGVYGVNAGGGIDVPGTDRGIGSERWEGPPYGEYRPTIEHSPTVDPIAHEGTVYAPIVGTNDIASMNASDGSVRWRVTVEEDDVISASFGRPTIKNEMLFVANWPNQVSAYDIDDGSLLWEQERADQMQLCTPASDAGIIVTSRTGVALLDTDDGDSIWERDLDGNATEGTAAITDDTVLLSDGNTEFHALDLETGELHWSKEFHGETQPVVADGIVYAVEQKSSLHAFDVDTGTEQFSYEPSEVPLSPPIIGDERLYLTNRRRVLALEETA